MKLTLTWARALGRRQASMDDYLNDHEAEFLREMIAATRKRMERAPKSRSAAMDLGFYEAVLEQMAAQSNPSAPQSPKPSAPSSSPD